MSRIAGRIVHGLHARDTRISPEGRGTDLQLMRESNWLLVLNYVRTHGGLPRAEVARQTGLSRTTVGNIIDDLLTEGLVRESGSERAIPSGGRRVIPVHFNADVAHIVGIALGRHRLIMVVTDLGANIIGRVEVPFPAYEGPDVCLPLLAAAVRDFISSQGLPWNKVIGVGVGMPGIVKDGICLSPTIPGWVGTNVYERLCDLVGLPIYLDNNAKLGALGESRFGNARDVESMLYVRVGTGIGGGLVLDGQVYRGGAGSAGEIGHMVVDPHGPVCACGNNGCLETFAGKQAIVDLVRERKPEVADIVTVLQLAQAGDPICIAALQRAGASIGAIVSGLVNFISPVLIVVDGSTMRAGELVLAPIRAA
ncbi:MAG: ROK family transcriptional regulator, partial [Ktedonobacterales bacterium]|nr:ROK family transcriptional regulator [Ktedonobacterales bacterium]